MFGLKALYSFLEEIIVCNLMFIKLLEDTIAKVSCQFMF